jgi:uncharacterized protein RhaS with RHS repeats
VNLYRFGARYYDTNQGRFTQYDPSGQEANPYSYAAGDPIGYNDPTGLSLAGAAVEAGVGTVLAAGLTGIACATFAVVGCLVVTAVIGIGAGTAGGIAGAAVDGGRNYGQRATEGAVGGLVSAATGGIGGKAYKFAKTVKNGTR